MDHYSITNHLVLYFNDPVLSFSVHFFDCFSAFHLTTTTAYLTQRQVLTGVLLNKTTYNSASLEYHFVSPLIKYF